MLAAPLAAENTTILLSLAFGPYRDVAMRFFFDAFMGEPAPLVPVIPCFKDYIGSVCQPLNQRSSLDVSTASILPLLPHEQNVRSGTTLQGAPVGLQG